MEKDNEIKYTESLIKLNGQLENLLESLNHIIKYTRSSFDGEYYITDSELSKQLKISKRTLVSWRKTNFIPYFYIGGKVLYRASDIKKILDKYHVKISNNENNI